MASLVDLADRVFVLVLALVVAVVFFVTRDFASLAFTLLVAGTAAFAAVFRFGGSSMATAEAGAAARARVTRRGFAGLAAFLGAMVVGLC